MDREPDLIDSEHLHLTQTHPCQHVIFWAFMLGLMTFVYLLVINSFMGVES